MVSKKFAVIWGIVFSLFLSLIASADPPPLMHVDELRPGMKGIGKTVFSGTTVEEFDVEIVAVLKNQTPHGDAIMAKVSGGPVPLEYSGVLAGMSGSPVYIDGKLIGAIAYIPGLFLKEPMIAGITPIHEMIRDAARSVAETGQRSERLAPVSATSADQPFQFIPIQTPLVVSGADPRILPYIKEQVAAFNMFPIQGGSVSQAIAQEADTDLQPGSAVGVQLIRGDMDISAVGTVTYRDGDRMIAFGHPMLFAGPVNFPMSAAYVHLVVPNQMFSFKMASSLETVGTITRDQRTGISGIIGTLPDMIPLQVTVQHAGDLPQIIRYTFEVLDEPMLLSTLMAFAGLEAVFDAEKLLGKATIHTHTTIALKDHPPIVFNDAHTGDRSLSLAVFSAFQPLQMVVQNPFEPVSIEHVSLDITVADELQAAEIMGVRVQNNYVRPGENIEATISLRPYNESQTTITEQIQIPEDVQQERLYLLACDSTSTSMFEVARAGAKFQPQNLAQLIEILNEHVSQNTIVMSLFQAKPGAVVQGEEFPSPPVSMMSIVNSTGKYQGKNAMTRGRVLTRRNVPTQYVVSGCVPIELIVDHYTQNTVDVFQEDSEQAIQGDNM